MKMNAIDLRPGNVLDHDGKLYVVIGTQASQPGKGGSVIQVEMRNVHNGNKDNVRFRTQESVERVILDQSDYQFLYAEDDECTFMNNETFEQINVSKELIGECAIYLQDGMIVTIETHEGQPLNVELPATVVMEVVEAEPVVKGQTASSSYKPGKLENGAKIMVPPHIEAGTKVVVKTEDGSYVERAKD